MDRPAQIEKGILSKAFVVLSALCSGAAWANVQADEPDVVNNVVQLSLSDRKISPLEKACSAELKDYCSSDSNSVTCLANNLSKLSACCAASVNDIQGTLIQDKPFNYNGIQFSKGSSLQFDRSCQYATVISKQPIEYKGYKLAAGPVIFDKDGQIGVARFVGGQQVRNLILAEEQPLSSIYKDGTPANVSVKAVTKNSTVKFGPYVETYKHYKYWQRLATWLKTLSLMACL